MIRFHAVANDLAIIYPKYSFKDKKELISILKNCFSFKFKEFLSSCEQEKDLLKRQKQILAYLNGYAYFPLEDRLTDIEHIIGLKQSFINEYKDYIFQSLPNSLKKENIISISSFSDKKLEFMNNFHFYKFLSKFSLNYDKDMLFLLKEFNLSLEDIPVNLKYIFESTCSEEIVTPFSYYANHINNQHFFNIKNMFYLLLFALCKKEVGHLFIGRWYGFTNFCRDNVDTRFLLSQNKEIKQELISRSLPICFSRDNERVKQEILDSLNQPDLYEDMLNLLKFLKSTLRHLD